MLSPILLHYYITDSCNCRCGFCNIWQKRENRFADPGDVEKNLTEAQKLGIRFVDFTGGEPLLHPDLDKMLHAARSLGLYTSVTTNCTMYPNRAKLLAGKIDFLHFSLDGLDSRTHDSIRGRKCFDAVLESIDLALSLGERPDLLFTVTERNIGVLEPMAEFARRLSLMLIVNPLFHYFDNGRPCDAGLDRIGALTARHFVYLNQAQIRLMRKGGNQTVSPRCRAVDACIVVSPGNEMLLPCYHFARQSLDLSQGLVAARKSAEVSRFRSGQGRFDFCQGCSINCYFDPSFFYKLDRYFFFSLKAKAKYYLTKKSAPFFLNAAKPAREIAEEVNAEFERGSDLKNSSASKVLKKIELR